MTAMDKYLALMEELCQVAQVNGDFKKIFCHNQINQIEMAEWEYESAQSNLKEMSHEI
jgi:hypothetical protein